MKNCIALYLRLSLEDLESRKDVLNDESSSIQSQRLMLRNHIENILELKELPILEFVDDGHTGTNFERPSFQRMMELVRTGEISCIVVKDLSRFGRNYLEVGDYLEHLFPFLGVRFIAVNDHYDSNDYIGSTGGLDVAFRNFIYQRYSQDLSEKIKTAKHMRMEKGKHITHCPYGYRKQDGIKDKMFVDPVAASIVRDIFHYAIDGKKTTEIAAILNERNIPTPMIYKKLSRKNIQNDVMWSHQAVLRIIKDYKYTGAMVTFKCESETIRAKAQKRKPPEEWVIIENAHEAIVTHEEYERANATIRKVKYNAPKRTDCKDRVYYCGHCGRRLRKTFGLDEYYSCSTKLYRKDAVCSDIFWSRSDIEKIVLSVYRGQLQLLDKANKQIKKQMKKDPLSECRNKQKGIASELETMDLQSLQLYENYRGGIFDREAFLVQKNVLTERKEKLQQELHSLQLEEEMIIREQREMQVCKSSLEVAGDRLRASDDELRTCMYDDIERVTVYHSREIDIKWKFENIFQNVC